MHLFKVSEHSLDTTISDAMPLMWQKTLRLWQGMMNEVITWTGMIIDKWDKHWSGMISELSTWRKSRLWQGMIKEVSRGIKSEESTWSGMPLQSPTAAPYSLPQSVPPIRPKPVARRNCIENLKACDINANVVKYCNDRKAPQWWWPKFSHVVSQILLGLGPIVLLAIFNTD